MTGPPIAVATPMTDPAGDTRRRIRRAAVAYRDAQADLARARAVLVAAIIEGRDARLSHRQIGAAAGIRDAMTVLRFEREGRQ